MARVDYIYTKHQIWPVYGIWPSSIFHWMSSCSSLCYLTRFFEPITVRQLGNTLALFSILKPGKDPGLPSSCWPISLLDTIGKLFERILLTRILFEVGRRGVMRNEQVGFRPKHSTALQITRFVERVYRNFRAKRLKRRCLPRCGQDLRYCVGRRSPLQTNSP